MEGASHSRAAGMRCAPPCRASPPPPPQAQRTKEEAARAELEAFTFQPEISRMAQQVGRAAKLSGAEEGMPARSVGRAGSADSPSLARSLPHPQIKASEAEMGPAAATAYQRLYQRGGGTAKRQVGQKTAVRRCGLGRRRWG